MFKGVTVRVGLSALALCICSAGQIQRAQAKPQYLTQISGVWLYKRVGKPKKGLKQNYTILVQHNTIDDYGKNRAQKHVPGFPSFYRMISLQSLFYQTGDLLLKCAVVLF